MRSIVSTDAIRSVSRRWPSSPNGRLHRFTRKPGPSTASITTLPIASPVARATASASSEDCSPATTSSSRISGAGLKKCIPTTRSGRLAAPAIAVTSSEEVLDASTHCSETTSLESVPNNWCLSSRRSGAASITSPQGCRSWRSGAGSRRAAAALASSSLQRPRSAPRSRCRLICSIPRSSASGIGSCSSVLAPASAASCAIPAPIVPAPATPIVSGRSALTALGRDERVDPRQRASDNQLLDLGGALV